MAKLKKRKIKAKAKKIKKLKAPKRRKVLVKKKTRKVKKIKKIKKTKKPIRQFARKGKSKKVVHKKRTEKITEQKFSGEALFKAKIKVIGIGGGGGSIVSEIGRSLEKATFVIADTDIRALKKRSGIKYFWFGEEQTHGLGTGVNIDLAKQAAESAKEKINGFFKEQDIIIFVASLGGGVGSGATQVFADAAREFGGITVGIFTLPFKFEGKKKYRIAQNALRVLRQSLNVSIVIPNEKIFKVIDISTPITNAFSMVNKNLIESLESLIDLIYNPGIINIDFADLRTILKGRGNTAFLNTIEESGKDRIEKTCENIFKNPLLQNSAFKAEKILFDIAGSENLSMFEVEKISSYIANLNPKAKIIFGISKDAKLKNKIKTTILMTGGAMEVREKEEVIIKKVPAKVKIVRANIVKKSKGLVKKEVVVKKRKPKKKVAPVSVVPMPETAGQIINLPVLDQKRLAISQVVEELNKNLPAGRQAIRRSGLEIRKAEELEEKKKIAQEKEWEIPAFLRKVKFKS